MNKLYVIGMSRKGLDEDVKEVVSSCDTVIGPKRQLDKVKSAELGVKNFVSISPLEEAFGFIRENLGRRKMVVLSGGDPLFFGIGRKLVEEFGGEHIEFIPAVSSMQLAFAKIKEPWDGVFFVSVHGRGMGRIVAEVGGRDRVCIFTDNRNTPARVAGALVEAGLDYEAFVCENMGMEGEKITRGKLIDISKKRFYGPNVMILLKPPGVAPIPPIFGLSESEIAHTRGLITKDEVRAVTLHKLRIPQEGVLWDIGSGSGSVAIEAARLSPGVGIFAIEKEKDHVSDLLENKGRFSVHNLEIVHGEAPDVLSGLPEPDRVFIGGSGGRLEGIIRRVSENLKDNGRVVLNATTMDTLTVGMKLLESAGFTVEVVEVSIARTKKLKGRAHLFALNPVFLLAGER